MFKKRLALVVAAFLVVALAGCGKNAPEPGKSPPASASNSGSPSAPSGTNTPGGGSTTGTTAPSGGNKAPDQTTYEKVNVTGLTKGGKADVGPLNVALDDVNVVTGVAGVPQGYAYVVLKLSLKNNGAAEYTVNVADHFKLTDPAGKNRPFNMQATQQRNPRLQGTVPKGGSQSGWAGYLVKLDAGAFKLAFTHPDYGAATWEFSVK